jgi:hypothetical protein
MLKSSDSANARPKAGQLLVDRFRCSQDFGEFVVSSDLSNESGYFRFGSDIIGYGQCSSGTPAKLVTERLHDASGHVVMNGSSIQLPFDPVRVVDNLRCERYCSIDTKRTLAEKGAFRHMYYLVRPLLPVPVRRHIQKVYFRGWDKIPFPTWPVDRTVENIFEQLLVFAMKSQKVSRVPFIWFWPEGAPSCTMLTHDVETSAGVKFCPQLMDLNDSFGIKTSFHIVPEKRYPVPDSFLNSIHKRGFEVNVHDLNHDGHLFRDREEFLRRAERINEYGKRFGAMGFRSAVMYRNVDWYGALDFSYDMSIPNSAHLDPQRGGCCTVFPFFVGKLLELPVTATQDYSLFHVLGDYSIRLWKEQIALIREKHGLVSFIIHPDYVIAKKARRVYTELLQYLSDMRSRGETWIALPNEVATWWRLRSELSLVKIGDSWRIEGKGSERARIAYARLDNDTLTYEFD